MSVRRDPVEPEKRWKGPTGPEGGSGLGVEGVPGVRGSSKVISSCTAPGVTLLSFRLSFLLFRSSSLLCHCALVKDGEETSTGLKIHRSIRLCPRLRFTRRERGSTVNACMLLTMPSETNHLRSRKGASRLLSSDYIFKIRFEN
ncbi:uncharacterized protein LOC143186307 [Calliopsis andreniformis]|uniref:uncharacterized protein LOC143186307 n=1 Tax=Calliopsis andreniformis TaxID=337506 RepID=UPI003FCEB9C0